MWKVWRSDFIAGGEKRERARVQLFSSTAADGVVGHGRKGNRLLVIFFCFVFCMLSRLWRIWDVPIKPPVLPRNLEWRLKRRCWRWEGEKKKKHSTLKAYFHNDTHEQAEFFSAEPQLLQCRSAALKVSRSSVCCTVSRLCCPMTACAAIWPRVRQRCVLWMKEHIGCPAN